MINFNLEHLGTHLLNLLHHNSLLHLHLLKVHFVHNFEQLLNVTFLEHIERLQFVNLIGCHLRSVLHFNLLLLYLVAVVLEG